MFEKIQQQNNIKIDEEIICFLEKNDPEKLNYKVFSSKIRDILNKFLVVASKSQIPSYGKIVVNIFSPFLRRESIDIEYKRNVIEELKGDLSNLLDSIISFSVEKAENDMQIAAFGALINILKEVLDSDFGLEKMLIEDLDNIFLEVNDENIKQDICRILHMEVDHNGNFHKVAA